VAKREHVILCGFGRVGQNVARVLEAQGFEYIAIDLDAVRVRTARQIGQPVVYGDFRRRAGARRRWVSPTRMRSSSRSRTREPRSPSCVAATLRGDVPVLVRTPDDSRLLELKAAGAPRSSPRLSKRASCSRRTC
jgi:CPA2 family monovalent cation:H+ antiporter-2